MLLIMRKNLFKINSNKIRPKIILAIAKTRIGEGEESIKILNELYENRKDAEVALAIADYYYPLLMIALNQAIESFRRIY